MQVIAYFKKKVFKIKCKKLKKEIQETTARKAQRLKPTFIMRPTNFVNANSDNQDE